MTVKKGRFRKLSLQKFMKARKSFEAYIKAAHDKAAVV